MKACIKLLFLLGFCFWAACSDNEAVQPSITVDDSAAEFVVDAEQNAKVTIHFHSTYDWQASADADWLVVSPNKGLAGDASISVLSLEQNRTGEERVGHVTLASEGVEQVIPIRQLSMDVINLAQDRYEVPADGGEISLAFETNLTDYQVGMESEGTDWILLPEAVDTRALQQGVLAVVVQPNPFMEERSATIRITLAPKADPDHTALTSTDITIVQEAAPVGVSVDFSADKQVGVLQVHAQGRGIPVVIMGDGFLDTDIANGYYRRAMEKAMENFFTEEPFRSLRDYFDVWMVNAVSLNNAFGTGYSTVFQSWLEGGGSTLITGDNERVMEYAQAVPELAADRALLEETLCLVILNTQEYAGTCHFGFTNEAQTQTVEFAVCYCPTINGLDDDMFRRVLCHEAGGHGFSKLMDEYSYQEQGAIPDSEVQRHRTWQRELGWAMNVDFVNDPRQVLWSHFLQDPRYQGADAYGEMLSVYLGACTYWTGAYRPTNDSMMRNNQHGFNAPSRESIYKRIMKLAYGDAWTYDYEEFVAFDLAHLPQPSTGAQTKAADEGIRKGTPPQFAGTPLKYVR